MQELDVAGKSPEILSFYRTVVYTKNGKEFRNSFLGILFYVVRPKFITLKTSSNNISASKVILKSLVNNKFICISTYKFKGSEDKRIYSQ